MNRPCLSFFSILSLVVAGQLIACGEGAVEPIASSNIALHCPVSFGVAPNYPRRARGPEDLTVLTDGRLCEGEGMMWLQAGSVGWSCVTPVGITVDLGKVEAISGVGIHLAAGASNTQWPLRILILVSDDGKNFYDVGDLVAMSVQAVPETGYATHWYSTDRLQTHGRFLKLLIEGAGEFRYAIADEVEVRPGDSAWVSRPFTGDPIGDASAYFWKTGVRRRVGLRIGADLESARKIVSASKSAVSKEPFLARLKELHERLKDPTALALPDNRAILPLNDLHRDLMAAHGQYLSALGLPPLVAEPFNPWDYLDFVRVPKKTDAVSAQVVLMRGETRPVAVNLTNATAKPMDVHFVIEGFPPEAGLGNVYEIVWTDTEVGTPVASAMQKLEPGGKGYATSIPAGVTRQIWIDFKPGQRAPSKWQGWLNSLGWFGSKPGEGAKGIYQGKLVAQADGNVTAQAPIEVQVFNRDFPAQSPSLRVGGWDYTDADHCFGITPENRNPVVDLLKSYGIDRTWGSEGMIGFGKYDAQGNLTEPPDMTRFDRWVELWPHAKQYMVSIGVPDTLQKFERAGPEFNRAVAQWTTFVAKHAESRGVRPDQMMLLLVDEPQTDAQVQRTSNWSRPIKSVQSGIKIYTTPVYPRPREAPAELYNAVDVIAFPRHLVFQPEVRELCRELNAKGKQIELYACAGPTKHIDPYTYYRLQAWTCFDACGEGSSFWAFCDNGRGSGDWAPYLSASGSYTPYFLDQTSITPGKAMEAIRAGTEDFEYLTLLRKTVEKLRLKKEDERLVDEGQRLLDSAYRRVIHSAGAKNFGWAIDKNRTAADEVRKEIGVWLEKVEPERAGSSNGQKLTAK